MYTSRDKRTRYSFRKEWTKDLPPFDPNRTDYTERELELYSDKMLRDQKGVFERAEDPEWPVDGKRDKHPVLLQEHIEPRWRKEVSADIGTVDAAISESTSPDGQRMFYRQHPQGRKVNSHAQRTDNGASYFRG